MLQVKQNNLKAYDRTEQFDNYADAQSLESYRDQRLKQSEQACGLIERFTGSARLNVLELCSGNSRLLYALAIKGYLNFGVGVEVSGSRYRFAEKWREDLGYDCDMIDNINMDVMAYESERKDFDLVICLDGSINFLYPVREDGVDTVLDRTVGSLKKDGLVIIEFITRKKVIEQCMVNGNKLRSWEEYPDTDPFVYMLSDYRYHPESGIVEHEEVFVRRDGYIDYGKNYSLKIYSPEEICSLMSRHGVKVLEMYDDWDLNPYDEGKKIIICVGRKF